MATEPQTQVNDALAVTPAHDALTQIAAALTQPPKAGVRTTQFWMWFAGPAATALAAAFAKLPPEWAAFIALFIPLAYQVLSNLAKGGYRDDLAAFAKEVLGHLTQTDPAASAADLQRAESLAALASALRPAAADAGTIAGATAAPAPLPACPACGSAARVEATPDSPRGKFFCPCNEPNPPGAKMDGGFFTPLIAALALFAAFVFSGCAATEGWKVKLKFCRDVGGTQVCAETDGSGLTIENATAK